MPSIPFKELLPDCVTSGKCGSCPFYSFCSNLSDVLQAELRTGFLQTTPTPTPPPPPPSPPPPTPSPYHVRSPLFTIVDHGYGKKLFATNDYHKYYIDIRITSDDSFTIGKFLCDLAGACHTCSQNVEDVIIGENSEGVVNDCNFFSGLIKESANRGEN